MRLLPLALVAAALVNAGCSSGSESSTRQGTGPPETETADAGELSALARALAREHRVVVLPAHRLPREKPVVPPPKKDKIPAVIEATAGLRVDLPGRRDGFVYRYGSHEIASAAAPSFLGALSGGVSGCGAQIWFSGSPESSVWPHPSPSSRAVSAEVDWEATVRRALKRTDPACRKHEFLVIA